MRKQPIPVLFFTNTKARGGTEEHMLTLLAGLDRACFRLHLVCPPVLAERLGADIPKDVEVFPLSLGSAQELANAGALFRYLRRRRIGILHSHMFHSSFFASPVAWAAGVPVIVETPHVRETWRTGWIKSRFFIDRLAGKFVGQYIAVSEANARFLQQTKRLAAAKITVIQNGVDLSRFAPEPPGEAGRDLTELRRELGFGPEDPVLLVAARLEPQKGHRILLEALPAVRAFCPAVRVALIGEGSLRSELERQVRLLGLEQTVRFLGFQPDVSRWLRLACLSVLPSFYEGLPLAAIESLAAERPVVATAVDGTPEVVIDGVTGFTTPPGDAPALARAICRLLAHPDLARSFSIAGRRLVYEQFNQTRQIQATTELYLRLWSRETGLEEEIPLVRSGINSEATAGSSWIPPEFSKTEG